MKLIAVCPQLQASGPGAYQQLEREVRRCMERSLGTVTSASGMTASLAINYCERNQLPYRVTAVPGAGLSYHVERTT